MAQSNKFGTFKGVFTPSILTILGVIMYMRLPMIVGEAGLFATIGIIVIAHVISATTGLSVSSIATDKKVKAGGTYYMISRSLGLPIGGTLGLALFVGLSFSVSLYLIGFAESFLGYWGLEINIYNIRIAGSIVLLVVTIITFISTSLALKTQYFIMAAIALSLVSIVFGHHEFTPDKPILGSLPSSIPLVVLFGIFFPAVTGFEAGVSMSGDLKDPKKSIPIGSISVIIVGFVVYIALAVFLSYMVDAEMLATDPQVLMKIAWVPELVLAGIWGATLSSALGSILGAPRILQATAVDKITPKIFAKGTGKTNEPRNALILTFLIAEAGILIGELDVIARVVSIFFITTYGFLNLSAAFERLTSADFRPSFKPPAWISIVGAFACFLVMIQLDFVAMIGASVILGLLYLYLKRKELVLRSGDAWSGIWASLVKTGLKRLNKETIETRNWRPNVLMFSGEQENRPYLVELGKDITNRLGILTGFELKVSNEDLLPRKKHDKTENFFMNVLSCRNIYDGMDEVVRVYGFSGVEPNTVLMGWNNNPSHKQRFVDFALRLAKNNLNALFVNHKGEKGFGKYKTIDIWWSGWGNNLSFAITLLRHLTSSANWKDAKLRVLAITDEGATLEKLHNSISKIIDKYRLTMEVRIINNSVDKLPVNDLIWRESENSCLTILGISADKKEQAEKTLEFMNKLIDNLGTTLLINASSDFEVHNLVAEIQPGKKTLSIQEKLHLPDLKLAEYEVINDKIKKIDTGGLSRIEGFYDKTFSSYYTTNQKTIDDLKSLIVTVSGNIEKLKEHSVKHKKNKIWIKSKTDFYFQAGRIIDSYTNERLKEVSEQFDQGVSKYIKELENGVGSSDKMLSIKFGKDEFRFKKKDSAGLRYLKLRKRLFSPFSRKTITLKQNYHKISTFYLKENGYKQINNFLTQFSQNSLGFIASIRDAILLFENELEAVQKDIFNDDYPIEKFNALKHGILIRFEEVLQESCRNENVLRNNLLLEYRRNLQLFCTDLGKINANSIVARKRRSRKYYQEIKEQNLSFAEDWNRDKTLYSNLINLDLQVFSMQFRLKEELNAFEQKFRQQVDAGILLKTRSFIEQVGALKDAKIVPDLDIDSGFLQQNDFSDALHKGIDAIIESVPEKIEVADLRDNELAKASSVEIPLKKVAKHFINILLASLVDVELKMASDELKKITYRLKDHLSYMHFELENIDDVSENETAKMRIIIQEAVKEINIDEDKINRIRNDFELNIRKNTDRTFEALSSHKITLSSKEISQTLREFMPKKSSNFIDKFVDEIRGRFKAMVLKLLYSRSEGVLLARELSQSKSQHSLSEQMLDLLDEISPRKKVYDSIPAYYRNLFSGRSSISEDFWIERPVEEAMFDKAWKHYLSGYYGAVMVLGERNSGKTAFCRYATKKYCQDNQVYQVFPPANGSTNVKEFTKSISHVTNLRGSVKNIIEKLPHQSVMVFNDLELWWESSENGLNALEEILSLIKTYSAKCFFVINMNKFSYNRLRELLDIDEYFISIMTCQPFDSEELKDLILRRHRSSGLKMSFGKIGEGKMSEIRMAGIFNKYFNYSEGNPGLALSTWLASVNKLVGDKLFMRTPEKPNLALLHNLNNTWKVILSQLLLHKRMDTEKLTRVLQIEQFEVEKNINAMKMAGLVTEKSTGLHIVNPVLDKFLSNYLYENGFL